MEARLQRRIQRYGWDLAAAGYEPLWQAQLRAAQTALMAGVALAPDEQVLDVACGTGLVSFDAARAVGPGGRVLGIDLSGRMVDLATRHAREVERPWPNVAFARMDAEALDLPDAQFDAVLCALGLMYLPDPAQALREMRRVLRSGGRLGLAVWGERSRCGWSSLFEIVDAEVRSEVCPLFFGLGQPGALERLCGGAGFDAFETRRITATLDYRNADEACEAAFAGGPVALAWSRFDAGTRARVRARYLQSIEGWRQGSGYRIPGEFVVATAMARSAAEAAATPGPHACGP